MKQEKLFLTPEEIRKEEKKFENKLEDLKLEIRSGKVAAVIAGAIPLVFDAAILPSLISKPRLVDCITDGILLLTLNGAAPFGVRGLLRLTDKSKSKLREAQAKGVPIDRSIPIFDISANKR